MGAKEAEPSPWDIYKLTVEMADRISTRRTVANSFFLTIHTALATFVGILASAQGAPDPGPMPPVDAPAVLATSLAGIVLAISWWVLLRSYRDLNSAKFRIITRIERNHFSIQPFVEEWQYLKNDPIKQWRSRYAELGFVERVRTTSLSHHLYLARSANHLLMPSSSYIAELADRIQSRVPDDRIPADSWSLFLMYAVLARAKGTDVTSEDVHDAWVAWCDTQGLDNPNTVPFAHLDARTQAKDDVFTTAIRLAAAEA